MKLTKDKVLFELRGLSKWFGNVEVLRDLDLDIEKGRTTVIIGPSGCGKTVLLKHLIMLMRPNHGTIHFDGRRIDNLSEKKLSLVRRRFGFLFQAGALFDSQTVAENVAFAISQHTRLSERKTTWIVREKLKMVGLEHLEDRYPSELSGGQRKRVALARAIALEPEVILYDEPTTGLDPIRADAINELIIKLQRELRPALDRAGRTDQPTEAVTSIAVTHDMNSAYKIADRIVMLSQGHIIADGNTEQIRASKDERVQQFIQGRSEGLQDE
ncbi:MAG: ABC transporter ATP-binding protein [Sedimentisphaerales bacterium]|nr:ABC transporter ATP-binding protein [Sedimentisphaerales bacterium]